MARNQLTALKNKHLAIIDFMLDNPTLKPAEVAEHFKMSSSWFYHLQASDVFKQAMQDRRDARQVFADYSITKRLERTVEKTLMKLDEVLDGEPSPAFVLKTAEVLLSQTGMGKQKQTQLPQVAGPGQVQINLNGMSNVSSDVLKAAQERAQKQYSVPDAEIIPDEKLVHNPEPAIGAPSARVAEDTDHRQSVQLLPSGRIQIKHSKVQSGEEVRGEGNGLPPVEDL